MKYRENSTLFDFSVKYWMKDNKNKIKWLKEKRFWNNLSLVSIYIKIKVLPQKHNYVLYRFVTISIIWRQSRLSLYICWCFHFYNTFYSLSMIQKHFLKICITISNETYVSPLFELLRQMKVIFVLKDFNV